jgi:uncharacterized membrane protein YhaH (DUF805 family)
MNVLNYYVDAFKKYATFAGRANRAEYWYFVLFNIIAGIIVQQISKGLYNIYQLAAFLPGLAIAVRRLHDSGKNGWWILLPFYNLYLVIRKGDAGANMYGEPSKPVAEVKATPTAGM